MMRIRNVLTVALMAAAVALALAPTGAQAKKRKTVRVAVNISLLHIQSGGIDRFSGLVSSPFTRCAQFSQLLLTKEQGTSGFGPFTPPVGVVALDSGPTGTFQISSEPAFVPPYGVHRYVMTTPERSFKTRRKLVVCMAGASPPAFAYQPAD